MHVGLNAQLFSTAQSHRGAGISEYIYSLLRHLPEVAPQVRLTAFLSEQVAWPGVERVRSRLPTSNASVRILWEQLVQPVEVRRRGMDLLHSLAFAQPLLKPCPTVLTVYDLSFLLFPDMFRPARRLYLSLITRLSVHLSNAVITISQSTKEDLRRLLGLPSERIWVTHCGLGDGFRPLSRREVEEFRERKNLPARMILFLGTLEPRKNLARLLAAYAHLGNGFPYRLVIAGARGWGAEQVFKAVQELDLEDRVLLPGYIPKSELPLWYNAAEVFIYPSLYEGFGLPPLEAMACGTPVIASDRSSLPEVVGEAGLVVNPESVEEMAEALERVLGDDCLREEMAGKGLTRAKAFSWRRMAEETLGIYREVLEARGGRHA